MPEAQDAKSRKNNEGGEHKSFSTSTDQEAVPPAKEKKNAIQKKKTKLKNVVRFNDIKDLGADEPPMLTRKIKARTSLMFDVMVFGGIIAAMLAYGITSKVGQIVRSDAPKVKKKRSRNGRFMVPVPAPVVDYSVNPECGLVLGKSSSKRFSWGVFAIKNFTEGELVSDFGLPIQFHHSEHAKALHDLYWDAEDETAGLLHLGNVINSHPSYANVHHDGPTSSLTASRNIFAGSELFLSRGLEAEKSLFELTDDIVKDLSYNLVKKGHSHKNKGRNNKDQGVGSALKAVKQVVSRFDPAVADLLPLSSARLFDMKIFGSETVSVRNRTEYIVRKTGQCIDRIKDRKSTIDNAGRGGFAQRRISEGELIMPALLYAMNISLLEVPSVSKEEKNYQPLINYCFGHDDMSIVFCHATAAALINHRGAKKTCSNNIDECAIFANAEYNWSSWNDKNNDARRSSPKDVVAMYGRDLSFDIIATRDIEAGEEIFIDYGTAWERAWDNYQDNNERVTFNYQMTIKDELIPKVWRNKPQIK